MPNCVFQFKQFAVWSQLGGFKVGTDAVLLGAWADLNSEKTILDIGTGSGVVSLMLAQRTKAYVSAIEIDENAANQASWNFQRSPFGNLQVQQTSFQEFVEANQTEFDHIVCNPPFFQFSSKPNTKTLKLAKHTDELSPKELFALASEILSVGGKMTVIFPFQNKEDWMQLAGQSGLFPHRMLNVRPFPETGFKRIIVELRKEQIQEPDISEIILEEGIADARAYSQDFRELMADYYIRF